MYFIIFAKKKLKIKKLKKKEKKREKKESIVTVAAHCMYWAFKLFIHKYTCPSKIHSLEEPSPWLFSAISWPLTRVQLLLSFWWVQFCFIERYYLYIFYVHIPPYPTIPHWPTHFVLKLTILLFVISFSTYSKIPTKKKPNSFEISDPHY